MYKSLASKVFWLFFPLATISIIFGVVIYYGQTAIIQNNSRITLLKDFQLQLKQLEILRTHSVHSVHSGETGFRENFETEIQNTEEMITEVIHAHADIPPDLLIRLEKIPFFMKNFTRAYAELLSLHKFDSEFPGKNALLLEKLHIESDSHVENKNPDDIHRINDLLKEMMVLQVEIYHNRQITSLPALKQIILQIKSNSRNQKIDDLVQKFGDNIENNFVNFLEIKNREAFLHDTSKRFLQVASDTIEALGNENVRKQSIFIMTILSFTMAIIIATLISWVWASRYIRRFLRNQQHAMAAIKNGNYDFTLPEIPEDEIGDLSHAMQTLAGSLKKSLKQLKSSERKYRDLVDNLSDWVWEVDENGRYTYASEAVRELLGYTPAEIIGKTPFDFMPEDEATRIEIIFSEYAKKQQSFAALKNIVFHKEGHEVTIETSGKPIIGENGILRGYRGVDRDITARELALQEQSLLEEQLYQAQKLESIGRLAGGVAHDFNNILSAINGYAELSLLKMGQDNPYRKEMATILESGQRAARLTQQLLAFSRKQIIKQQHLNINNEIKEIYKMLSRLLGEDIEIVTFYSEDLWPINADRSQLEQVIINLAVNARDAMHQGGKLTIETENIILGDVYTKKHYEIEPGNYVVLSITDNGQGIPQEVMGHIFEPFFTTKEMSKGTGLGLATVYGIIKQNGGEIKVYSEPEQGTTFKIYFPRAEGDKSKKDSLPSPQSSPPCGTETILLVEDDELVRKLSFDILTNQGYTILEAQDGIEALNIYQRYKGHIDLLLTDVVMPKMSGTELTEKIRKIRPDFPVLFMSGYTENAIVQNGILKSGVNFVQKPVTPLILSVTIRELLDSLNETTD